MSAPDPGKAVKALEDGFASIAGIVGPMLIVVFLVVLAGAALQGGVHLKKFRLDFEHFNLLSGIKRLFGTQAIWGGVKALLKASVVGLVLYTVVQGLVPVLLTAGGLPVSGVVQAAGGGIASLVQFAVAAGIVLAAADFFVVMRRNRKKTRMSKKEVQDENKSSEGDPLIRSQRRARQMAMSRNRMIAAIGDADVVLVNPTHVAVALKYEPGKSAPRVVAKGAGHVAARIREEAEAKNVPMVQDIPLTRALHGACELGQEIPVDFYRAVAGVLAFVMSLKARGAAARACTGWQHGATYEPHDVPCRSEPASVKGPHHEQQAARLTVPIGIVGIVLLLVVPVPAPLLDVLIVCNILLALLVLLTSMFVKKPLDFSVFPSLLLVATLFRLGLNVASTRLVLGDGYAGQVIEAFGKVTVGGSMIIGAVVFLILVVIQFVVVTKGAERVAEVGARFTLDAMPGKQMAIDADLNAGLITDTQARERRAEVSAEADFYGAMDGASKFVKGDAIAGHHHYHHQLRRRHRHRHAAARPGDRRRR